MRIIGHGIDLVSVPRIARMLADHGDRFLVRVYTTEEVAACAGHRRQAQRLASRFAAKEAVLKALGTGMTQGLTLRDVGVVSLATGQPTIHLTGAASTYAAKLGIQRWHISLTDTSEYAMASVIAEGE